MDTEHGTGHRIVLKRSAGTPIPPDGTAPPARTVYCAPAAGTGAQSFLASFARWPLRANLRVVQLPGREDRMGEPHLADLTEMADLVAEAVAADGADDYALFGHSFGALVMLETARRLEHRRRPPALLAVAACAPPHLPTRGFDGMDSAQIAEAFQDLGRMDFSGPLGEKLAALVLPALTADCRAFSKYLAAPDTRPVGVPILAMSGTLDAAIPAEKAAAWRHYTRAGFTALEFGGGHFFPLESDLPLRAVIDLAARPDRRGRDAQ